MESGLQGGGRSSEPPSPPPLSHARDQGCRSQPQTQQSDPGLQTHPLLKPSGNTALGAATKGAAMGKALLVLAPQRAGNNTLLIGI